jgi:hypothetical protein
MRLFRRFLKLDRLLKNSPGTRFHPRSGTKHACFGAFQSPICGRYQLNTDFFNSLWTLAIQAA